MLAHGLFQSWKFFKMGFPAESANQQPVDNTKVVPF
jgi:hypothetical protein